ncbi:hypothetical protein [Kaistella polysaccharea]|uniref:hypothetical protein n=1 Tax=Kaistella polysaccharea TaxID=2878534 RepID=UPI001CF287DF|nr:hypothetical protein [Kaistella polysaccharea]
MRKNLLFLLLIVLVISCKTQSNEYLKFETGNAMIIGGETSITLIPTNKKRAKNETVKIFYANKKLDNRKISKNEYNQIVDLYKQISIKDTAKMEGIDPPYFNIEYRRNEFKKDFCYTGNPKKGEKFRKITELIFESAKLQFK